MFELPATVTKMMKRRARKETDRKIYVGQNDRNRRLRYSDNSIKTSKYNILTFIPLTMFEQFQHLANCYFLAILILQFIPQISSITPIATMTSLLAILSLTALKDAIDDIQRHGSDKLVNRRVTQVICDGELRQVRWSKLHVGDIVRLENDDFVPADLVLLSSSEPHGACYVETADLDGETNVKYRQSLRETATLLDDNRAITQVRAEITCEAPNHNLNRFEGTIQLNGAQLSLSNTQVLLRGCILRNTLWCYGLVVFAGKDTKLMQNSGKTQRKTTNIDRQLNHIVIAIAIFLIFICAFCAIGYGLWENRTGFKFQVIQPWDGSGPSIDTSSIAGKSVLIFFSYLILFNVLVPLPIYVSVEFVRGFNSLYINFDSEMVHKNVSAKARSTNLIEELGQIEYIFSDKTGTLTQNIMTFKKCSINGRRYGDMDMDAPATTESHDPGTHVKFQFYDKNLLDDIATGSHECDLFFRLLSVCHTVMPDERSGHLIYQAQSPDEGALVDAAHHLGFVFRHRSPESITCEIKGTDVEYELLDILDFNNVRKRMSVILRKDSNIFLFCKGADTVIMERLSVSEENERLKSITNEHLSGFATEGLRTLCLAWKEITVEHYGAWKKRYHAATILLENREEKMDTVAEEIEKDLLLIGATAVEDKLQDGVPNTIACLIAAGIKIWVLTGDKQETAVNIGYSSKLLRNDMQHVFIIDAEIAEGVQTQLEDARKKLGESDKLVQTSRKRPISRRQHIQDANIEDGTLGEADESILNGMVIQGKSLEHALSSTLEALFLEVTSLCRSVICCRVTPLQKALVVGLVRKRKDAITLAIGDGANDVSMIKVAHIGIGISGQEGMQAVLASDYSIAQFRFLKRLLLVHGRWSYYRMSKFLHHFFYKTFACVLCNLWYAFFCGFTAQTVFEPLFITFYNLFFTSVPVVQMAAYDQDVNAQYSLVFPQLYASGPRNLLFNKATVFRSVMHGILTSVALFFVLYGTFHYSLKDLQDNQAFAVALGTIVVVTVNIQAGLDTSYWTLPTFLGLTGTVAVYFSFTMYMYSAVGFTSSYHGAELKVFESPAFWLTMMLAVTIVIVPVVITRSLLADTKPTLADGVRLRQQNDPKMTSGKDGPVLERSASKKTKRSSYTSPAEAAFGELKSANTDALHSIELR